MDILDDVYTRLALSYGDIDDKDSKEALGCLSALQRIEVGTQEMSGLSYLCTPQNEWLGNDQSVTRAPHIVCDN